MLYVANISIQEKPSRFKKGMFPKNDGVCACAAIEVREDLEVNTFTAAKVVLTYGGVIFAAWEHPEISMIPAIECAVEEAAKTLSLIAQKKQLPENPKSHTLKGCEVFAPGEKNAVATAFLVNGNEHVVIWNDDRYRLNDYVLSQLFAFYRTNSGFDNLYDVRPGVINSESLRKAEQVLIDNGIAPDEAETVLQALGYALLNTELYPHAEEGCASQLVGLAKAVDALL